MLNCLHEKIKEARGQAKLSKLCFLITDFNKVFVAFTKAALKTHSQEGDRSGRFQLRVDRICTSVSYLE